MNSSSPLSRARELEALVVRPIPPAPVSAVFYPDCYSHPEDDGTLYCYQRRARDVLRAPGRKNLLVASPTGSGKTFVIEECVRVAREEGSSLLIGEPLIALAEQIFHRLGGPGLAMRTGPSRRGEEQAPIVVGTYEALARALSTDPQQSSGCPRIVIDEFHYVGSDRGPVIQELLACCREGREVVALSGTMPNVPELAAFLSRINGFPTYVVGAPRRPVEISFYHYSCREDRMRCLSVQGSERQAALAGGPRDIGGLRDRQGLYRFLDQLRRWDCYPALVVTFSCRKLDELADWTAGSRDLSSRTSRRHVAVGFRKMLKGLPAEDVPLFERYRAWADKGVGVHHSHAPVPYLELVSWLAERRALSLVFSSSTLSAGINLPVRTVCIASARLPQKDASSDAGGVVHVDLPALLFHQLVGRAGRPGYEVLGNCIVLGKNAESYAAAQSLLLRPLEPVTPQVQLGPGEVLRALRWRRSLAHEALAVASAFDHELIRQMERDSILEAEALRLHPEPAPLLRQVEAALHLQSLPPRLRDYARLPSPTPAVLQLGSGGILVRGGLPGDEEEAAVSPELELVTLTCKQAAKKLPFEDALSIMEARAASKELLASRGLSDFDASVRNVLFCAARSLRRLADAPLQDEYRAVLRDLGAAGCVDATGCLTALGEAACELRTCPLPHVVLTALLRAGEISERDAVLFSSQVLAEGSRDDEDGPRRAELLASISSPSLGEALKGLPALSAPRWTSSVLSWHAGVSLAELEAEVPVGCLCRHLLRVSDCCEELAQALQALGAPSCSFEAAKECLSRGLPFLRRGAWKLSSEDEDGEEEDWPEVAVVD